MRHRSDIHRVCSASQGRSLLGSPIGCTLRARARRGLTLVEVFVALAVLAIGALAMVTSFISSTTLDQISNETSMALNEVRRVMEEIVRLPFDDIDQYNPYIPVVFDVSQGAVLLNPVIGEQHCGSVTISPEDGNGMKEVVVTVVWRSTSGGERRLQIARQVADHL